MGNELTEHPSGLKFTEAISSFDCVAINGHEEIVFGGYHSSGSKTGERNEVELSATYNGYKIVSKRIGGVAVDKNNNIYVVSWLEMRAETPYALPRMHYSYMLCILDEYYNVNGQYKLDCPVARRRYEDVMITINKNNDIIMSGAKDSDIYVCYERGHLKHKFKRELNWVRSLSTSN